MNLLEWNARNILALLVVTGLVACSGYSPAALKTGASVTEAERQMGPRTGTHALVDGRTRVEFARGPFGKHTYMLDFDAGGGLLSWDQVLTESHFNALPWGITREDVLRAIGHPAEVMEISWQKQTVWSYRYETPFCKWFQVSLDRGGRVVDTGYGPDPSCEVKVDSPSL